MNVTSMFKRPKGSRVLVIAPHPDDEIIGCGGSILFHKKRGDKIWIIYMCKGNAYDQPSNNSRIRKKESEEIAKLLELKDVIYLNHDDFSITTGGEETLELQTLIIKINPDIIYLPSPLDQHIDHRTTFQIFTKIRLNSNPNCLIYEVMTPITYNYLFPIDCYIEKKMELLRIYNNQLQIRRYDSISNLLNLYRGSLYPAKSCKFAEAFLWISFNDLINWNKAMNSFENFWNNKLGISWDNEYLKNKSC